MCSKYLFITAIILTGLSAGALPDYAIESASSCSSCHVKPAGWPNPAVKYRKCTLDCNACHVNPTGGGLRKAAGTYYGWQILPKFGWRPQAKEVYPARHSEKDNPMVGDPQLAPPSLSAQRYGGIKPFPTFQIGGDFRTMGFFPESEFDESAVFPMQADVYLVARPRNPKEPNRGRVTMLVNTGFEGDREKEYEDIVDRWFVKEWWVLWDDLPHQFYAKAGRFLPNFGWRLDDHTAFIRQNQTFDVDRQVTGVEIGVNPNHPYANLSLFNSASDWEEPWEPDEGWGAAFNVGYRDFDWHLGGSVMFETDDDVDQLWAGVQWAFNFMNGSHPWKARNGLPLIYYGELDYRTRAFAQGNIEDIDGLTTFHQITWFIATGYRAFVRYDWQDPDLDRDQDLSYRYTIGGEFVPFKHVSVSTNYRFNGEPFEFPNDEWLVQVHCWF